MLKICNRLTFSKVFLIWLILSLLLTIFDQATKQIALANLEYLKPVNFFTLLNSGWDFTLVFNEGAAFSFLSNAGGWQRWFFSIFALVAIIVLTFYLINILKNNKNEILRPLGIALVLSGALGNLIDRLLFGYVIDFISVYYKNWYWPAFNIADVCISVGVGLLIFELIFIKNK